MKRWIFLTALVMSTSTCYPSAVSADVQPAKMVAHRADQDHGPEDTIPAIISAVREGTDAIEIDIRWSKASTTNPNGVPVVIHDGTLDRTTDCTGNVSAKTSTALGLCNAADSTGYLFTGVPTLYQALKAAKDAGYTGEYHLELKLTNTPTLTPERIAIIFDRINKLGLQDKVTFISFYADYIAKMKDAGWTGRTGWIFDTDEEAASAWTSDLYTNLIPYHLIVTDDQIRSAQSRGIRVSLGVPCEAEGCLYGETLAMGADYVSVDRLDVGQAWRSAQVRYTGQQLLAGEPKT